MKFTHDNLYFYPFREVDEVGAVISFFFFFFFFFCFFFMRGLMMLWIFVGIHLAEAILVDARSMCLVQVW